MKITAFNTGREFDSSVMDYAITRSLPDGIVEVEFHLHGKSRRARGRIGECEACGYVGPEFEFGRAKMLLIQEYDPLKPEHQQVRSLYCNGCYESWKKEEVQALNADKKAAKLARKIANINAGIKRRMHMMQLASVRWRDREKIAAVYEQARRKTEETGTPHSVDHFYPIQGRLCCGLHVHNNLVVVTASENSRKSNRMPLDNSPALRGAFASPAEVLAWYRQAKLEMASV